MNIIGEIAAHEKELSTGDIPDSLEGCPKCNENHKEFKLHECKGRIFLVIEKDVVHRIESSLGRWKCLFCTKTFINYPSFALPYKRYTVKDILSFSHHYGSTHDMTYEKVAQHEGLATGYTGKEAQEEGRQLAGSTIWRWISFLGLLCQAVRTCLHLIMQKNPASDIARRLYPVNPQKHKSPERKIVLQQCLRLIDASAEHRALFGISLFPQFAIKGNVN